MRAMSLAVRAPAAVRQAARACCRSPRRSLAVAPGHGGFGGDRGEQPAGLGDGDFRGLALDGPVALAAHRQGGVEQDGVAADQGVKEVPQGGQVQLAGSDREVFGAEPVEVLADVLGADALQRQAALLAGGEEALDRGPIGVAGVLVAEGGVEELLGGEDGRRPPPRRTRAGRAAAGGAGRALTRAPFLVRHNILYPARSTPYPVTPYPAPRGAAKTIQNFCQANGQMLLPLVDLIAEARLAAFSHQRHCDGLRGAEIWAEARNHPRRGGRGPVRALYAAH